MKIQYFCTDLSHILKIGEIKEMKVELVNDRMVLRIDCDELVEEEYITMKVKSVSKKLPAKPAKVIKPESTLVKIAKGAHGYLKGKQQDTNWIEKMSQGPKW